MDEDECCVCFRSTTDRVKPCEHVVCSDCANRWFEKNLQCPFCRTTPCGVVTPAPPRVGELLASSGVRVDVLKSQVRCGGGVTIHLRPPRRRGACVRISVTKGKGRVQKKIQRCMWLHSVNGIATENLHAVLLICQAWSKVGEGSLAFQVVRAPFYEDWLF